ncbi:MAG: DUF2723 domain-containing protein [Planctomycetota bacterium]
MPRKLHGRYHGARPGLICGVVALLVYLATCMPGVGWQDSGIHQYRILTGWLENPRGLALSHPVHYWLGRGLLAVPLPLGEPAYRLNLLSVLAGAAGVGLLAATVAAVSRRLSAAYLAAAVLLVAHIYWQMSVTTEVYAVDVALLTLEWYLLWRFISGGSPWFIVAVFAVNGLHVANHLFGLLALVPYVLLALQRVWRRQLAVRWLLAGALAWLVTCTPYWALVLAYYVRTGDIATTLRSTFFGGSERGGGWADDVLNVGLPLGHLKIVVLTLGYNFPSLVLPIGLAGVLRPTRGRGRAFRWVLIGQTLIMGGFLVRYTVPDIHTFFMPICALVALWFGLGVDRLLNGIRGQRTRRWVVGLLALNAAIPPVVYAVFPEVARQRGWMRSRMRDIAHRDEYAHFFRPWRGGDDSPAVFAREALDRIAPAGWLLAEDTTAYTTAYTYWVHGGPPDVRIYGDRTCLNLSGRPYLSDTELAEFLAVGGQVVVVPGEVTERIWGGRFVLDRSRNDFWLVHPERPPQD